LGKIQNFLMIFPSVGDGCIYIFQRKGLKSIELTIMGFRHLRKKYWFRDLH